jgi:hypothetical protein
MGIVGFSTGVNRLDNEAHLTPPITTEAKNGVALTPLNFTLYISTLPCLQGVMREEFYEVYIGSDRLCGLVVRVSGY